MYIVNFSWQFSKKAIIGMILFISQNVIIQFSGRIQIYKEIMWLQFEKSYEQVRVELAAWGFGNIVWGTVSCLL